MGRELGQVVVEAGGETVRLYLGFNAQAEVEGILGQRFEDVLLAIGEAEMQQRVARREVRAVIWGAMLEHNRVASLRDASSLIDKIGFEETGRVLERLLKSAGWLPDEGDAGNAEGPDPMPAQAKDTDTAA